MRAINLFLGAFIQQAYSQDNLSPWLTDWNPNWNYNAAGNDWGFMNCNNSNNNNHPLI